MLLATLFKSSNACSCSALYVEFWCLVAGDGVVGEGRGKGQTKLGALDFKTLVGRVRL